MGVKSNTPTPTAFGRKLRTELTQREWGVRTLARALAARDNSPDRVESLRRQLKRYLSAVDPVRPSAATRHAIEDALGLKPDALADDDDEGHLTMSLDEYLRLRARQILREERAALDSQAG